MPKCRSCKYLVREKGEYGDEWCHIFGYDTPEKYVAWNGEGCRCTQKFLKKLYEENKEADRKYWEQESKNIGEYMRYLEVKDSERLD